jgi:hypothetical protein
VAASAVAGSVTIDPTVAAIPATATVNVRVLPTSAGNPIAEASDADTLTYHGIETALGGPLGNVFFNPNGTDGYMAEAGDFGPLQANLGLYTIEPFDVGTGTNSGVALAFTNNGTENYPIVQNDVALSVDTLDFATINYYRAAPLAADLFAPFTFPAGSIPSTAFITAMASNSSLSRSAYIAFDFATGSFLATRGDLIAGSGFSSPINITAYMDGAFPADEAVQTFAYDPIADRGYVLVQNDNLACNAQSPQLVTIDFNTGAATTRSLGIDGGDAGFMGYQMALDPGTGFGAIATSCQYQQGSEDAFRSQLSFVNLNTGATTQIFEHTLGIEETHHGFLGMEGGASAVIEIDPVNHLILQRSMYCPELVGLFDMNARPCLDLYDEAGRLTKTVPNLFPAGFLDGNIPNGANGTTRTSVAMGQQPGSFYVESFAVQPYRY